MGVTPPDKSKSIRLSDGDYAIKDRKTGDETLIEAEFNPIHAIVWSADSRSILVAAHVAKGILVQILNFADNHWTKYTIGDPEPRFHESILLDWRIRPRGVTLVCKITLEKENGRTYACYVGTYDVDPSTGKTSNLQKKQLNFDDCLKLESKFVRE